MIKRCALYVLCRPKLLGSELPDTFAHQNSSPYWFQSFKRHKPKKNNVLINKAVSLTCGKALLPLSFRMSLVSVSNASREKER